MLLWFFIFLPHIRPVYPLQLARIYIQLCACTVIILTHDDIYLKYYNIISFLAKFRVEFEIDSVPLSLWMKSFGKWKNNTLKYYCKILHLLFMWFHFYPKVGCKLSIWKVKKKYNTYRFKKKICMAKGYSRLFLWGLGCELVGIFHSTGKLPVLNRKKFFFWEDNRIPIVIYVVCLSLKVNK